MSAARPAGDQATVSVQIAVDPELAFEVFTQEIDQWWGRGPAFRLSGRSPGVLQFEPRVGGRLFETFETPSGPQLVEFGRVSIWNPPSRLVFEWRNANFAPGERTEVEVIFEPTEAGTRVTLHHRGWASLRAGHPARHGLEGAAVSRMIGLWWGDLLSSLREHVEATRRE